MIASIKSEFTKIITLRSVWLVTCILLSAGIFFHSIALSGFLENLETIDANGMHWFYQKPVNAETDFYSMIGTSIFNPGILFSLLGAVIAGEEFRNGQLGTSLLAVPSRTRLTVSKIVATSLYTLCIGLIYSVISYITAYLVVKDWRPELLWSLDVLFQNVSSIIFLIIITLISLGLTLIVRQTLWGVVIMGGFLGITMTQLFANISFWLDALTPISAARNLFLQVYDTGIGGAPFSSSNLVGGIVLSIWLIVVLFMAVLLMKGRDAR